MHILEIVSFLPPYGGYFAIEQALALQREGNRVGMLYCQQLGVRDSVLKYLTSRFDRWQKVISNEGGNSLVIDSTYFRGLPKMMHRNMDRFCHIVDSMYEQYTKRNGKPDLLHAHCAVWAGIAARRIAQREGIPYYITEHSSRGCYDQDFGIGWTHDRWALPAIREAYEKASCVIPVAEELVESTRDYFGVDYRYRAISNITDTDFFAYRDRNFSSTSQPQPSPSAPRKFHFCCLASSSQDRFFLKGYDVLARAFSSIENAELHIAGIDTGSSRFLELFQKHYGRKIPEDRVFIHGNLGREAVRELLYHCDALVHASRSEVQPLVILEALSTGIPVVTTECIPRCERFPDGVLVAPIGDAGALREKMIQAMQMSPSIKFHDQVALLSSSEMVARQLMEVFNGSFQ